MKQLFLPFCLLITSLNTHASVETMACKSYEATHELAKLYIRSAMFQLMNKLDEYDELGECYQVSIPDQSYMTKLERGQKDISDWVEMSNILAANVGRPPIENIYFFVEITLPDGNIMYSLESSEFVSEN